jgi:GT2 family glycosyltransferase
MKVSIVIPSLRPAYINRLAKHFKDTMKVEYKLIVISTFDIEDVTLVKEDEPKGIYKAVEQGMQFVDGDFILHMPDDSMPIPGAIENMIEFSKGHKGLFLGNFLSFDRSTRFHYEQGSYYDKLFAFCPFIRTKDLDKIDGILMDTYYNSFYGDPDLSLRVWDKGGVVATCPNAWMEIYSPMDELKTDNLAKYEKEDEEKFKTRWAKLGEYQGYKPYSRQIRGDLPL